MATGDRRGLAQLSVVFVAGMHRSGTSMATRALNLLGFGLGPKSGLLPSAPDNPMGFWESKDVVHLNNRLLAFLGGTWDEPPMLDPGWHRSSRLHAFVPELHECLAHIRSTNDPAHYVIKDPRLSLLMPLWRSAVTESDVVLVLRHPRAVCQSLNRRNGFTYEKTARLWLRYVASSLESTTQPIILEYESVISQPQHTLSALANLLLPSIDTELAVAGASSVVDPSMNHGVANSLSGPNLELSISVHQLLSTGGVIRILRETAANAARLASSLNEKKP